MSADSEASKVSTAPREKDTRDEGNRLLGALPADALAELYSRLEPVELRVNTCLVQAGEPITHVYFVDSGVVSLVAAVDGETFVEVATVGDEGMVGVPVLLGASVTAGHAFVQIAGSARRMTAEVFRDEIGRRSELRDTLQRYTVRLLDQIAQSAACNRGHDVVARCARWILMTHDRMRCVPEFPLSAEFMGQMLGVAAHDVASVTAELRATGAIEYDRGIVTVIDRARLEQHACSCYRRFDARS